MGSLPSLSGCLVFSESRLLWGNLPPPTAFALILAPNEPCLFRGPVKKCKAKPEGGGASETNEATRSPAGGRAVRSYMASKRR